MSLTSDEVNYVVWRYLLEAGYAHSAFTFGQESLVAANSSDLPVSDVPPGYLVTLIQKGLLFSSIEVHVREDGTERECERPFLLLEPHRCSAPGEASAGNNAMATDGASLGTKAAKREVKRKRKGSTIISHLDICAEKPAPPPTYDTAMIDEDIEYTAPSSSSTATNQQASGDFAAVAVLTGHEAEVISCAWNPRHDLLASASGDSTARLWPISSAASIAKSNCIILRHQDTISASVDDSKDSDGSMLATACYDGQARIWSSAGELVRTLNHHRGPIFALRWNPSGTALLSGGFDQIAIAWDAESGALHQSWAQHSAPILDIDWADDRRFATCSTDQTIWVNELGRPTGIRQFVGHTNEVNSVAWDPTGTILASCSDDTTAKIWDLNHNGCVYDLAAHQKEIYAIKWSPTGTMTENPSADLLLATASFDNTVRLWDPVNGKCRATLAGHQAAVYAIAFSPDGRYLASGSLDDSLRVWSIRDRLPIRTYHGHGGIFEVDWNSTGTRIAACTSEGTVCVLDFRA